MLKMLKVLKAEVRSQWLRAALADDRTVRLEKEKS